MAKSWWKSSDFWEDKENEMQGSDIEQGFWGELGSDFPREAEEQQFQYGDTLTAIDDYEDIPQGTTLMFIDQEEGEPLMAHVLVEGRGRNLFPFPITHMDYKGPDAEEEARQERDIQRVLEGSWWKAAAPEFRENDNGNFDLRFDEGEENFR